VNLFGANRPSGKGVDECCELRGGSYAMRAQHCSSENSNVRSGWHVIALVHAVMPRREMTVTFRRSEGEDDGNLRCLSNVRTWAISTEKQTFSRRTASAITLYSQWLVAIGSTEIGRDVCV